MIETIEIVLRKITETGNISETVLISLPSSESLVATQSPNILIFPGLEIHLKEQAVYRARTFVSLSHQEFLALAYMAKHPGWIYTKEQIYEAVYGDVDILNIENSIYCLIHSLRKKLETDPQHPKFIQTVRGVGYKFIGKPENPGI